MRDHLQSSIIKLLDEFPCAQQWCDQHRHSPLLSLLQSLFGHPAASLSADEQRKYLTLLLCGAFTSRQLTLASKSLGFVPDSVPSPHSPSARDARSCFVRLRLLCLDGIQTFFHAHKEQQR